MMIQNNELYASGGQGGFFEKSPPCTPQKTFFKPLRGTDDIKHHFHEKFLEVSEPFFKKVLTRRRQKKGKILRVKQGYNPNSSSMGSIIFVLPAALLAVTTVFGALSGLLAPLLLRKIDRQDKTGRLYLKLQKLFFNKKIKNARQGEKK